MKFRPQVTVLVHISLGVFHSTHQMSNASSFEVVCLRDMNKGVNRLKGRVWIYDDIYPVNDDYEI